MDEKRLDAGRKLIAAAYEFWEACHEEGQHGAVQWLECTGGELIIFTRGEYRKEIIGNIFGMPDEVHKFGEEIDSE